jgi:hypothetical protein
MFSRIGNVNGAWLAALAVTVCGMSYAVAQESTQSEVDVVQVEPVGERASEPPTSASEQKKAAAAAVESASASCGAQAQALESATRDGDIIRATCLDDKLAQCDANLQSIKRRQAALDDAIARGDAAAANHESRVISVLSQKFTMLTQAANQCVGQDLFDTGDTQSRSEVDVFAPDENPAVLTPVPDWPIPFIPPPVSGVN